VYTFQIFQITITIGWKIRRFKSWNLAPFDQISHGNHKWCKKKLVTILPQGLNTINSKKKKFWIPLENVKFYHFGILLALFLNKTGTFVIDFYGITRGSVGWACVAHLSFGFEET